LIQIDGPEFTAVTEPSIGTFLIGETINISHSFNRGFPVSRNPGRWFHNGDVILSGDLNINIRFIETSERELTTVLLRTNSDQRASGSYVFSASNPVKEISELTIRIIDG